MTEKVFTPERRGIAAWFGDALAGAKEIARAGLSEAMTWDLYKWTVLALMTATFILVALSYGGIRSELAVLKEERASASASVPDQVAAANAEIAKQISDLQAALVQAIAEAKTELSGDIAKMSTKLDAKPKAPAPRPRPRPQQ